jgi:Flp pilus assembly protein TadB
VALVAASAFFLALISPALLLYIGRQRRFADRERDLIRRLGNSTAPRTYLPPRKHLKERMQALVDRASSLPWVGRYLAEILSQASIPVLLAPPLLLVAGFIAAARVLSLPAAATVGLAAAAVPLVYLRTMHQRWLRAVTEQLPYMVDLLRAALESGHTLLRALQMAARNLPEPISSELRMTVEQVQLGMPVAVALESMYRRMPLDELGFLAAAVGIQSNIGSSLTDVLRHVSEGMRSRQRVEQELQALTAQSRTSAAVVTFLPFIVLAGLTLINPKYSEPLFHSQAGRLMLKTAVLLDVIAFWTMRRIARVDF